MSLGSVIGALGGWRGYAAAAAIGAVAGGLATGYVQGAIDGARIAAIEKQHADEQAAGARLALSEMVRLSNIIAGIDADYYEELTHAKAQNDKLSADLASGARRLRANVSNFVPAAASAAGLDDGAGTAELDRATAQSLAAIAGDGDRAIVKLTACQAYARAVFETGEEQ